MAELLIKAIDATHSDPTKDARGCYKRGDIVDIRPNGFGWGRLEALPPADGGKFVIVRINDVSPAQVRNFVRTRWQTEADGNDETRRRRIRIDADLLPANVRNTLHTTGRYTTTWAAIRQFVRNKQTNETATNEPIGA